CQNEGAEVVLSWLLPITEEEWKLGRLPWSYDQIWRVYQKAAKAASIGSLSTHSLRHYAEFPNMPNDFVETGDEAANPQLTRVCYMVSIRHSRASLECS